MRRTVKTSDFDQYTACPLLSSLSIEQRELILGRINNLLFGSERTAADTLECARVFKIIRARARRGDFFNPRLFSDPAWSMLLELYAASIANQKLSVKSLRIASGVPWATALRWIDVLVREGLICRQRDPRDRRRTFVMLSTAGLDAMAAYFDSIDLRTPSL